MVSLSDQQPDAAASDPVHVRVRGLHKSYGSQHVLRGVEFDIMRQQINIIIGASGAGKTVLLRQLIRLEKPDRGQIVLDGEDIAALSGHALDRVRRKLGMVFQMSALFDSMSVFDNVAFPLREHFRLSPAEVRERVLQRLKQLGIEQSASKMPSEISGGMAKRVAVARALVLEPELIVFDEPTTGLDPVTSRAVDELIEQTVRNTHLTALVITHDMASILNIADRVHMLSEGRIIESGGSLDLIRSRNAVVQKFLSASHVALETGQKHTE